MISKGIDGNRLCARENRTLPHLPSGKTPDQFPEIHPQRLLMALLRVHSRFSGSPTTSGFVAKSQPGRGCHRQSMRKNSHPQCHRTYDTLFGPDLARFAKPGDLNNAPPRPERSPGGGPLPLRSPACSRRKRCLRWPVSNRPSGGARLKSLSSFPGISE